MVLISKCMNIKRRDVEELREQVHASRQRLRVKTLDILYRPPLSGAMTFWMRRWA